MELFFVGTQNKEHDNYMIRKQCSRLFSFAEKPYYILNRYKETKNRIFIDSGAFSIAHKATRGKNLTIDDYITFINNNERPDLYAAFDVIPFPLSHDSAEYSAIKSWENYLYMLDRINQKDKLLPVYHYGEDFKYLRRILESDANYIAFGGRGGVHTKDLYSCLDKFFDIVKEIKPNVKVHAFGITVLDILEKYPFTSADSTSYQKIATMGGIFLECINSTINISPSTVKSKNHFIYKIPQIQDLILKEIEKYGYNFQELQNSTNKRIEFNVDYFMRWIANYKYKPVQKPKKKPLF